MSTKIKLMFGLLAFFAVVSVFSWVDYFNQGLASSFNLAKIASKLSFETDVDVDKDGLSNIEESYWNTDFQNPDTDGDGFKDGEEVASGHDPNKPGPDDSLKDINLTEKLAELTASGLYEGSLKPENDNYADSLANMTDLMGENAGFALNTNVSPHILAVIDPTSGNQDQYLSQTFESIKDFLTAYGVELQNINKYLDIIGAKGFEDKAIKEYFTQQERLFKEIFNRASSIYIPKNWENEHLEFLGEIKVIVESNRVIALGSSDPLKAAMAFNEFFSALDRIPNWTQKYINKNRKEGVNNTFIESLSK